MMMILGRAGGFVTEVFPHYTPWRRLAAGSLIAASQWFELVLESWQWARRGMGRLWRKPGGLQALFF
jgi:hypothetical protein